VVTTVFAGSRQDALKALEPRLAINLIPLPEPVQEAGHRIGRPTPEAGCGRGALERRAKGLTSARVRTRLASSRRSPHAACAGARTLTAAAPRAACRPRTASPRGSAAPPARPPSGATTGQGAGSRLNHDADRDQDGSGVVAHGGDHGGAGLALGGRQRGTSGARWRCRSTPRGAGSTGAIGRYRRGLMTIARRASAHRRRLVHGRGQTGRRAAIMLQAECGAGQDIGPTGRVEHRPPGRAPVRDIDTPAWILHVQCTPVGAGPGDRVAAGLPAGGRHDVDSGGARRQCLAPSCWGVLRGSIDRQRGPGQARSCCDSRRAHGPGGARTSPRPRGATL
jgi:hypothetical protein